MGRLLRLAILQDPAQAKVRVTEIDTLSNTRQRKLKLRCSVPDPEPNLDPDPHVLEAFGSWIFFF